MQFINEYVSDKDIDNYKLNELWNSYHKDSYIKLPIEGYRHYWVINKDANVYLIPIKEIKEVNTQSGVLEPTTKRIFILSINNNCIEITLDSNNENVEKDGVKYHLIHWELLGVHNISDISINRKDFLEVLESALSVFGVEGIRRQKPNTIINISSKEF